MEWYRTEFIVMAPSGRASRYAVERAQSALRAHSPLPRQGQTLYLSRTNGLVWEAWRERIDTMDGSKWDRLSDINLPEALREPEVVCGGCGTKGVNPCESCMM